jgi:hypothetical protein
MSYQYICLYCDYKWISEYKISRPLCIKCNDKNFKVKKIEKEKTKPHYDYDKDKDDGDWFDRNINWGSD